MEPYVSTRSGPLHLAHSGISARASCLLLAVQEDTAVDAPRALAFALHEIECLVESAVRPDRQHMLHDHTLGGFKRAEGDLARPIDGLIEAPHRIHEILGVVKMP